MNKAIFLDRDGTLIYDKEYLHDPEEVELLPGVVDALQSLIGKGYLLFLFTNQSGVGRGYFTLDKAVACNERLIEMLGLGKEVFKEICIAPEGPDDVVVYRKPSPKFILEMIQKYDLDRTNCWMLGDRNSDVNSGLNAAIRAAFIWKHKDKKSIEGVSEYESVWEFSKIVG